MMPFYSGPLLVKVWFGNGKDCMGWSTMQRRDILTLARVSQLQEGDLPRLAEPASIRVPSDDLRTILLYQSRSEPCLYVPLPRAAYVIAAINPTHAAIPATPHGRARENACENTAAGFQDRPGQDRSLHLST